MQLNIPTSGLKEYVHRLALVHGVVYKKTAGDAFAEAVTRLADDNVFTDDVENIIVELKRSHVIDSKTMVQLLGSYFDELQHV
jgi:hypothetical protein